MAARGLITMRQWDPMDPNRGCYTCGSPPSSHFGDGSPMYHCSHPPTGPRDDIELVSFHYQATEADMEQAKKIAARWEKEDEGLTGFEWRPRAPWNQHTVHWRSILAEIAASKITGLPRRTAYLSEEPSRRGRRKAHDIGRRTEIRCPQAKGRGLRFTVKDLQKGRLGLLVYDDLFRPYTDADRPVFRCVGWVEFAAAERDGNFESKWSTPEKPEWVVPPQFLRSMLDLPEDA